MKLYTNPGNFQTLKVLAAAEISGIALVTQEVKGEDGVVPYLSGNKLPVLEVLPHKFIFSANAATRYLLKKSQQEDNESAVDHWLDWESACLMPTAFPYLVSCVVPGKVDKQQRLGQLLDHIDTELKPTAFPYLMSFVGPGKVDEELSQRLGQLLDHIDTELKGKSTLTGEQVTSADVSVWATLYPVFAGNCAPNGCESRYPALMTWFSALTSQTPFQAAVKAVFQRGEAANFKTSLLLQPVPPRVKENPNRPAIKQQVSKTKDDSQPVAEKVIASAEEVATAREAWTNGKASCPQPVTRVHPLLPEEGRRNVLITSALPYVNNVPHLGNIIGCVLSADVFSRYCRLRSYNCLYICGTDEYGTATETKAIAEGVTPQQICDKYTAIHAQIYQWFNIDFDYFGRTTTQQQTSIAQDIFWRVHQEGYVCRDSIEQLYCAHCERFLADRFVEGTCPLCAYEDARGDQCDACGKLINAVELLNPKCKLCKGTPSVRSTDHLFLDLPKIEAKLQSHLDTVFKTGTWTNNAKVITSSWIRDGLKPRCISRDLKWGTPVPLEGYTDKVFYVWFDAPIGYISITANYTAEWERWWKAPDEVELYNFLGKDNVPFHSVIFPATLIAANDNYTVVKHMSATEYLNYEDGKFSKSRNNGIFGDQAKATGIPADIYRFYLLYVRPESQDSSFSWDDFLLKNNSELLNNLGNFINRALTFVKNSFGGVIQEMALTDDDVNLLALITRELHTYIDNLEDVRLRDSIRNILSISRLGNQYMQENKPWVLVKGTDADRVRAGTVVSLSANIACLLSVLLQPYMPQVSATIQSQLNAPACCNVVIKDFVCHLPPGHTIGTPSPLFQKIEASTIAELKKKFSGTPAPVSKGKGQKDKKPGAPTTTTTGQCASPEDVERLMAAVAAQGLKVRELKANKAEKSKIDAEVTTLLDLKKQLTAAQGPQDTTASTGGKQKGGKKQSILKNGEIATPHVVDQAEVERLTGEITLQGNKVRELKGNKATKGTIDAEVAVLLGLKVKLADAQGHDPAATSGTGKRKGKKK